MSLRITMAEVISLVRDLIGDEASATQLLTDLQIQRALDNYVFDARYQELEALDSVVSGTTQYLIWYAPDKYWEDDAVLCNASYTTLTPSVSDPLAGRWTFTTSQTSVLITGKYYDVYAAAADLLETLAAKYAGEYDVNADGASLMRSQRPQALLRMATQYRRSARSQKATMVRNDLG